MKKIIKDLISINPFTNQVIATYSQPSDEDLQIYLNKSALSHKRWASLDIDERISFIKKLSLVLKHEKEMLAKLATAEMGKPLAQSTLEVEKCIVMCEYYANSAFEVLKPKTISTENKKSFVLTESLGPILAIMPWNFPYWQVLRFAIPTLLSGNVVILKHASNVSGCSLAIDELFKKAGFPEGVFQSLLISSDRVETLVSSSIVKGVSLTGSTDAGRKVAELAGRHLKKMVLELGGSDPYLILEDADLKHASQICMKSRLQNNGQSCIAAKRFIVLDKVFEDFKSKIITIAEETKSGDPLESSTNLGPLARKDLKIELHEQVKKSVLHGGKISHQGLVNAEDAFYPVTILENIDKDNPAYAQEFFGPVIMLFRVHSIEEAIEVANDTTFGLGSAIFSQNVDLVLKHIVPQLQAGNCFINTMVKSDPRLPFGGIKESGYGRELSANGLLEFTNQKTVSVM